MIQPRLMNTRQAKRVYFRRRGVRCGRLKPFNSLDEKLEENLEKQRDHSAVVPKVVNSLVDSNKYCSDIATKRGGKHRLAYHFNQPVLVYCDHTEFGDDWIIFQYRCNGEVEFSRDWADYREGFGNLDGEFWLGLEHLHKLTSAGKYQLLVEMEDHAGKYVYAKYDEFAVLSEKDWYKLEVGCYSGTAGDFMLISKGHHFDTEKEDHILLKNPGNWDGGWWSKPLVTALRNRMRLRFFPWER